MRLIRNVISASAALFLTACGGGYDTPLPATVAPVAPVVTPTVTNAATNLTLSNTTSNYLAARTAAGNVLFATRDLTNTYLNTLSLLFNTAAAAPSGTYKLTCSGGGSASIFVSDADHSGSITSNDSALVSYTGCVVALGTAAGPTNPTLDGSMVVTFASASGPVATAPGNSYSVLATIQASGLQLTEGTVGNLINGTMAVTLAHMGSTNIDSLSVSSSDVTAKRTAGTVTEMLALANWTYNASNAVATAVNTISVTASLNVTAPSGTKMLAVNANPATPLIVSNNSSLGSGAFSISDGTDAVTTTLSGSNLSLAIDAGNIGVTTATVGTNGADIAALLNN